MKVHCIDEGYAWVPRFRLRSKEGDFEELKLSDLRGFLHVYLRSKS